MDFWWINAAGCLCPAIQQYGTLKPLAKEYSKLVTLFILFDHGAGKFEVLCLNINLLWSYCIWDCLLLGWRSTTWSESDMMVNHIGYFVSLKFLQILQVIGDNN